MADSSGKIVQGDQIVDVNGQDLTTCTQEFAARVLKVYSFSLGTTFSIFLALQFLYAVKACM